jgi:hypothetical protein
MPQKIDMVLTPRFQNTPHIPNRFTEKGLKNGINQNLFKNTTYDVGNISNYRNIYNRNQNLSPKPYSASKINFSYTKNISNIQKNAYIFSANGIGNIYRPNTIKK